MNGERNVRLTLEYDGTEFAGWQRQPNARTVQAVLEDELLRMTGAPVLVRGAGRTDSGVHARAQVATFTTRSTLPAHAFHRGLNVALPRDLAVLDAADVPLEFDPRRHARGKRYIYRVLNRSDRSPLLAKFVWHLYRRELDLAAMSEAAGHLIGEHDFSAFRAAGCDRKNPVRIIRRLDIMRTGDVVELHVEATAFLRHMVRIITGTLVEVGLRRRPAAEVAAILAGKDRARAGRTAPPEGLTLEKVFYADSSHPSHALAAPEAREDVRAPRVDAASAEEA